MYYLLLRYLLMKDFLIFFLFLFSFKDSRLFREEETPLKKKYANNKHVVVSTVKTSSSVVRLFLAGDFMPGRGIDAVMPRPCPLEIREGFCASSIEYARLAERKHKKRFPGRKNKQS